MHYLGASNLPKKKKTNKISMFIIVYTIHNIIILD